MEREVEELRQLWKSESYTRSKINHSLLPNSMFLNLEEDSEGKTVKTPSVLKRWESERLLKVTQTTSECPDGIYDHDCSCVRRAEVVKYRGISLFNEVGAQYSALQAKYEELLQRCHLGLQEEERDEQSHKSVQTPTLAIARPAPTQMEDHQPEYKELFREIFSRIQKTKEDLIENRGKTSAALPGLD